MTPLDAVERICDAHHHLWDREDSYYVVDDLMADLASVPAIEATVFVECSAWYREDGPEHLRSVGETEWVATHGDPVIKAIVGATDLRLGPRVDEALDAHTEAGGGRFRGIRHRAAWDPNPKIRSGPPDPGPHLLVDPDFRKGMEALTRRDLSFDAWVYYPQLAEVADLARAFPDTRIVLNHLGGPLGIGEYAGRRDEVLAEWREAMREVAACENVVLKLGGIGMSICGLGWHKRPEPPSVEEIAAAWRAPMLWCIQQFGPDRCLFESNFPVDRFSVRYAPLWEAFAEIAQGCSAAERDALFFGTAASVYRIG
jgi:L-fuconolactonase